MEIQESCKSRFKNYKKQNSKNGRNGEFSPRKPVIKGDTKTLSAWNVHYFAKVYWSFRLAFAKLDDVIVGSKPPT